MTDKPATPNSDKTPVVVDMGKYSRKRIKKLRRGEGSILEDVHGAMSELESDGKIDAGAQPVIIVVREKNKSKMKGWLPKGMKF